MDNPVVKSAISSIVLYLIGMAAGKLGLSPDQLTGLSNAVVTVITIGGGSLIALLLTWWKARQHTQAAMITSVNQTKNGVIVVPAVEAAMANITAVNGPIISGPLK